MSGLNAPDSSSSLRYRTVSWSCLGGRNSDFLRPNSGVMSEKNMFCHIGPRSDHR